MKIYDYQGKKNVCGSRVKETRRKQKLTQENLAAQLQLKGVTLERDSISRIEMGTRFVCDYEVAVLSEVLSVRVAWLLGVENE